MSARPTVRRSLRALLSFAAVTLVACSEPTAPLASTAELSLVRGAEGVTATPTAITAAPLSTVLKFAAWAPPLSTYDTSFAVVVGTASTHQVMFKGASIPFLKLEIPTSAVFFDANGVPLSKGTAVAVTARIDRVNATVKFGPHGTLFSERLPAKVSLNYFALDLAGRRPDQLFIWYQPDDATSWDQQATKLDVNLWWLGASILHFSNYAISY